MNNSYNYESDEIINDNDDDDGAIEFTDEMDAQDIQEERDALIDIIDDENQVLDEIESFDNSLQQLAATLLEEESSQDTLNFRSYEVTESRNNFPTLLVQRNVPIYALSPNKEDFPDYVQLEKQSNAGKVLQSWEDFISISIEKDKSPYQLKNEFYSLLAGRKVKN